MQAPTKGRVVLVITPKIHNNQDVHPAIVTAAFLPMGTTFECQEGALVNLHVIPDLGTPYGTGSAPLFESQASARDYLATLPPPAEGMQRQHVAFWPPRA